MARVIALGWCAAIALVAHGCGTVHDPTLDAGIDAAHVGCGIPPASACCQYGGPCMGDGDCTDRASPHCVPNFASGICAADSSCGHLCASPDTPIATPTGEHAIVELRVGMRVWSVDHGALVAVPISRWVRNEVSHHAVVHVVLATGRSLEMSPGHPTADGRTFGDLVPGETLDGVPIVEVEMVPYAHPATYDILPASDTGTYVAAGVLVGSTLAAR